MHYSFLTVDVFTTRRFGGNPLAVLPDAQGLSDEQMQAIAREFNYSESTFVLAPENEANDAAVRIFTPWREVPFAGHPNIGTAFALSMLDGAGSTVDDITLLFEEKAGVVPVDVRFKDGKPVFAELTAPEPLTLGEELDADGLADLTRALMLNPEDIVTSGHRPREASVGLPFLMVEVMDLGALERAKIRPDVWDRLHERTGSTGVHIYTRATGHPDLDIRCRMFAATFGVREDPATGSANCALAGLRSTLSNQSDGTQRYRIAQGVEMGRPSTLLASVDKRGDEIAAVRIGGSAVMFAEGFIEV